MTRGQPWLRGIAVLAVLPVLSGCIAAVAALPVLTGTTIASKEMRQRAEHARARAQSTAAVLDTAPAAVPVAGGAPQPVAIPGMGAKATLVPGLTALPPPDAVGRSEAFAAFSEFALAQAQVTGSERVSAMKSAISSPLSPRPIPCPPGPAAVMLDLDPGKAPFDPAVPMSAVPGLPAMLASLRAAGLTVIWISRDKDAQAQAIRGALTRTGLDPTGVDRLVLAGGDRDTLAAQREAVTDSFCVVALAGDQRGDFDLLYDYLRNPDAVVPTDALIGNGWFLTPPPLN